MAIDLSNLKLVEENIDTADDSQYADAQEFPAPIAEGEYTFIQGKPEFTASKEGFLSAVMDHVVTGGENDGKILRFDRVSNKPFDRQGVKVSMMKDQLRAIGDRTTYRTHTEYATALSAGEGKPFKAVVKWDGYCGHKDTGKENEAAFTLRGAKNFPNGADVPCPTCGKAVQPRARIDRRIAAS